MRSALLGTATSLLLLLSFSCSSDDKDPITKKCEATCTIDPSNPCASRKDQCLQDCRGFGKNAQTFGGLKCAECVCSSFVPLIDTAGACRGFDHKNELSTECRSSCVSPDGSAPSGI